MTLQDFLDIVKDGRIFTVHFYRRTAPFDIRDMTCRVGVKKNLKGIKYPRYFPDQRDLLVVFDMHKRAYRMVNLRELLAVKISGKTYLWNNDEEQFIEKEMD